VLQSGKKRRATIHAHCRRHDGSCYPVEATLLRSVGQGKPIFIWMASDVSQPRSDPPGTGALASDLRAIVAHIPGMAYQVLRKPDGSTSLRYVSEQSAQLLGIKAAALRADPERFFRLILDDDKADYLARLAASGGSHMTFNWEGRIWMEAWKDVKWVNIRVGRRETPAGLIWDGIMLNVTHSKQAEAEIRRSRAKLSALTAHVESVKEQERLNLAREVHDDLGGNLTAIKIGLSWLKRTCRPMRPTSSSAPLTSTTWSTRPSRPRIVLRQPAAALLDFGIVSAIDWQLKRFAQNTDIACD